jgi:hypothetical protein
MAVMLPSNVVYGVATAYMPFVLNSSSDLVSFFIVYLDVHWALNICIVYTQLILLCLSRPPFLQSTGSPTWKFVFLAGHVAGALYVLCCGNWLVTYVAPHVWPRLRRLVRRGGAGSKYDTATAIKRMVRDRRQPALLFVISGMNTCLLMYTCR